MLQHLYIRNFALIEELSVSFDKGLTIVTGQTGAGKSVLIGALNQVLGARASTDMIRSGTEKAVIEATLSVRNRTELDTLLEETGIEPGPEIILRREINLRGSSRCFINDTPCPLQILRQTGDRLIDLHGQHEHQLLLRQETHISMLDAFAGLTPEVEHYRALLEKFRDQKKKMIQLRQEAGEMQKQKDMLQYQLNELDSLGLRHGEDEELEEEINILENAETLFESCSSLKALLYDNETSAFVQLSEALHTLQNIATIDKTLETSMEDLQGATSIVEELSRTFRNYTQQLEFNPSRLDDLRQRQHQLQKITKKYARPLPDLILYRDAITARLDDQASYDENISLLEGKLEALAGELSGIAEKLHDKRKTASLELSRTITGELSKLGIPYSVLPVNISLAESPDGELTVHATKCRALCDGADIVEFMISTNPGEAPRPLQKTASGGEISRIMLAIKTALASSTSLPILIFDEIDTGISGTVAEAVGKSLKALAGLHQIIAITHLPQIAAMADNHLFVEKKVSSSRTRSMVRSLDRKEHVHAVAQLIGGNQPSDATMKVAAQMVDSAGT
ncbi:DNA repair protein RecN [Prosthecochloris sp. HL-130-GSB]|jgi:DNA repair protein RecN (Recombination protein N)|uniref:DNA repair protein RecN n=1 Tax=Prosthecochloris sp. HL-130-GSB TaxID=1974213 RepID=UPI000A1C05FA|nr:DNA repair protein RecN [Prosthecochloris sp. HL-130-GSB]ARM30400.1 DNA repair protein RecN [Prosthecochloris sp. HL-130-GSB]MBO8092032.1 DNA repair protein RecN [Prosthecochloris sp.]